MGESDFQHSSNILVNNEPLAESINSLSTSNKVSSSVNVEISNKTDHLNGYDESIAVFEEEGVGAARNILENHVQSQKNRRKNTMKFRKGCIKNDKIIKDDNDIVESPYNKDIYRDFYNHRGGIMSTASCNSKLHMVFHRQGNSSSGGLLSTLSGVPFDSTNDIMIPYSSSSKNENSLTCKTFTNDPLLSALENQNYDFESIQNDLDIFFDQSIQTNKNPKKSNENNSRRTSAQPIILKCVPSTQTKNDPNSICEEESHLFDNKIGKVLTESKVDLPQITCAELDSTFKEVHISLVESTSEQDITIQINSNDTESIRVAEVSSKNPCQLNSEQDKLPNNLPISFNKNEYDDNPVDGEADDGGFVVVTKKKNRRIKQDQSHFIVPSTILEHGFKGPYKPDRYSYNNQPNTQFRRGNFDYPRKNVQPPNIVPNPYRPYQYRHYSLKNYKPLQVDKVSRPSTLDSPTPQNIPSSQSKCNDSKVCVSGPLLDYSNNPSDSVNAINDSIRCSEHDIIVNFMIQQWEEFTRCQ